MGAKRWSCVSGLLVATLACGDDGAVPPDASVDSAMAGVDGGTVEPATPRAPALPMLGCPAGWVPSVDEGVTTCDPWADDATDCPRAEARFPGDAECAPIGAACPAGSFPDDVPAGARFVLPGATDGDGSRERPFGRIADALAGAGAGTTIVLARGTYDETVRLGSGVTLRGACPSETILAPSGATTTAATIDVIGAKVVIRDLGVGPSALPGIYVSGPARSALVQGVEIRETAYGIFANAGARVTVERSVIAGTNGYRRGSPFVGNGLDVEEAASLTARRVIVDGSETGLFVGGALSVAVVEDSVLRRTVTARLDGVGAGVIGGGHAELTRVVSEGNQGESLVVSGAGSSLRVDTVVVRDTRSGIAPGLGVEINDGASLEGRALVVDGSFYTAIVADNGASATLEDLVLRDGLTTPAGMAGLGCLAEDGGSIRATRIALFRNQYAGGVSANGGSLDFTDAWVIGNRPRPDGVGGYGLVVFDGELRLDGAIVRANVTGGIRVSGTRSVSTLDDVVVSSTEASPAGSGGNGLVVQGAVVVARRLVLTANREVSVHVVSDGDLRLDDATIATTLARACAETTCTGAGAGTGLGVYDGSRAALGRFVIEGSPLCGVQLAGGAMVDLRDGAVRVNAIGACVQEPGYDVRRLSAGVIYADNGVDIDTVDLTRPLPAVPLDE